jgi:hypothetical protein
MDSMRSLNTSLPTSRSHRSLAPELLQAFKSAALSVTNLYKTAVTDQGNTRQQGYQDALDDLLTFLDRENLGVQDGEGWKIRQWATERFDGGDTMGNSVDSDDDRLETEKRARSSSPVSHIRTSSAGLDIRGHSSLENNVPRTESAPPPTLKEESHPPVMDRPSMFTFSAAHLLPTPNRDVSMHTPDTSSSDMPPSVDLLETTTSRATSPLRVEVVNRNARLQNRHVSTRHNTRSANRDMSFASGTKRKLYLPEFFDISNVGNPREGTNGGGKRGRHV